MSEAPAKRPRSYSTHAVVLRRRDYLDADRIITVFTPGYGKRTLIAKGARKTTSRKAGHVELFTHANLQVAQARTWDIVTEAVTVESFRLLRTDLHAIGYASYACELVDCFTEEEDENQLIWDLLLLVLRELDDAVPHLDEGRAGVLLRWFELHLLSVTGFQPQFFHCIDCGNELEPVANYLLLHAGGVICPDCWTRRREGEELAPAVLKVLRFLQSRPWSQVSQLSVRLPVLRAVQNILFRYLLTILEHQLKSTDFLRRLQHGTGHL